MLPGPQPMSKILSLSLARMCSFATIFLYASAPTMPPHIWYAQGRLRIGRNVSIIEYLIFAGNECSVPHIEEVFEQAYDLCLIVFSQVIIERQSEQPGTEVLGDGTLSYSEFLSHCRQMQRNIVKHAQYSILLQVLNQSLAALERGEYQIKHVISLLALGGNHGQANVVIFLGHALQMPPVVFPESTPLALDFLSALQLRQQERGQQVGRQITGPDIHPSVLIDLTAEELAAVGALFADDHGAFDHLRIVHHHGSSLTANDVLSLVKALCAQAAEGAGELAFVASKQTVSIVLNHSDTVLARYATDRIHFAGDAGVVHRNDGLCPLRDERLQTAFVEI